MRRAAYILLRFAEMVISSNSRLFNAAVFGGSTYQTVSARAYIDGRTNAKWARRRNRIDRVFWFDADHCKAAWQNEVDAARKTLDRAGATPSQPGAA